MKIVTINSVFLARSGIGLKNLRLVEETIHQYKGKRSHFYKYALFQFFLRRRIRLQGRYFVIHNHWCPGYYHWITEALPRLLSAISQISDHVLVLPESFKNLYDSITPLYQGKIYWIPVSTNLVLETLLIPENPPLSGNYNSKAFNLLRETYRKNLPEEILLAGISNKVYVSRAKASRRKVANEEELILFLSSQGFSVIHFEDYSFWHQVAIMHKTDILISIHGAGLANALFLRANSCIIELQKKVGSPTEIPDVLYRDFSETLRLNYNVIFCEPVNKNQSLYDADIIVNLEMLKELLLFTLANN